MAAAAAAANVSFGVALGGWTLGPYDNRTFFDALAPPRGGGVPINDLEDAFGRASLLVARTEVGRLSYEADEDGNGVLDTCDLSAGAADTNANGVLDTCEMAVGDLDLSGIIDFGDIALIAIDFGPCTGCPADLDNNGTVNFGDIALALLNFGPVR